MSNNIDISIVIPVYNTDYEMIDKCISSIYDNSNINMEIIVVDDGSEDILAKKLDKISDKYEDVRIIHKKNGGVSSARNMGIKAATGKYLAFVDADDVVLNGFFSEAYGIAEKEKADYVKGKIFRGEKLPERDDSSHRLVRVKDKNKLIAHLISYRGLYHFNDKTYISRGPVALLVRSEIAKETLFDENLSIGEDSVWLLDITNKSSRIILVNSLWYFYYSNPDSACNKVNEDAIDVYCDKISSLKKRVDLDNPIIYRVYVEMILEEIKAIHRVYLYKRLGCLNNKKAKTEKKRLNDKIFSEEILPSSRIRLNVLTRLQLLLLKCGLLFTMYDMFRELRHLKGMIR